MPFDECQVVTNNLLRAEAALLVTRENLPYGQLLGAGINEPGKRKCQYQVSNLIHFRSPN